MDEYNLVFAKIAELAAALQVTEINKLPGAWIVELNPRWTIAVNGHNQDAQVKPDQHAEQTIPPFHAAIWYNGWPAGLLHPFDGVIAAGEAANEDALLAALDQAIDQAKKGVTS